MYTIPTESNSNIQHRISGTHRLKHRDDNKQLTRVSIAHKNTRMITYILMIYQLNITFCV